MGVALLTLAAARFAAILATA
ncbi:hypothetical protein Lxx17190 [Leifsonia xyli subsp. xyli str. CTCB07]|uniref:Uncharacterized protein n=1 Tax=Leifsonia xyli subsp. xyli (strain CTCB07) TaxID=281090 RepID=Q6ADR7_LEIXX|nr:hypothetical protein Lxx17190 [Leifsonia xyli subsp. xyli str. CTCB07]